MVVISQFVFIVSQFIFVNSQIRSVSLCLCQLLTTASLNYTLHVISDHPTFAGCEGELCSEDQVFQRVSSSDGSCKLIRLGSIDLSCHFIMCRCRLTICFWHFTIYFHELTNQVSVVVSLSIAHDGLSQLCGTCHFWPPHLHRPQKGARSRRPSLPTVLHP